MVIAEILLRNRMFCHSGNYTAYRIIFQFRKIFFDLGGSTLKKKITKGQKRIRKDESTFLIHAKEPYLFSYFLHIYAAFRFYMTLHL